MKRVVIICAGGHAREVAAIVRHQSQSQGELALLGFVVEREYLPRDVTPDLPILGDWSWFENADRDGLAVVCAVGDPALRKRLVDQAMAIGLSFTSVISPLAYVSGDAKIGQGVMVFPFAVISTNNFLGDHAIINAGSTIGHDAMIHSYATISPGVHIAGNVSLGEGSYLGIGSNVMNRVSIGAWTMIGAGSVVNRDVPDNVTAVGVPARIIKKRQIP